MLLIVGSVDSGAIVRAKDLVLTGSSVEGIGTVVA
jgi:hypothetical protein